jgi:hypothetical protein
MYCVACDRWEDDQIAIECEVCRRCGGSLIQPDDERYEDEAPITSGNQNCPACNKPFPCACVSFSSGDRK